MAIVYALALGAAFVALERARPGWELPRVRGWYARALAANAAQLLAVLVAGFTWDRWMRGHGLLDLGRSMGPAAQGALAYVLSTFVYYWWHRARHDVGPLWRVFHQFHHSPRRIEVITSFYKHPAEQLANTALSAAIAYPLLGLSPEGAAVYTVLSAAGEFVYHANVRTPRWLGWFFQRPEMHRVHHEYGRHAGNYGDLPVWDMLFGTYRNPAAFEGRCGFDPEREARVADMLAARDVHDDSPPRDARERWRTAGLAALLALGLSAVAGTALSAVMPRAGGALAALGKISLASPLPKVFCRAGDEEPFALRHEVTVRFDDGRAVSAPVDRATYARLPGPYAWRNVYGAALSFAPLLPPDTVRAVVRHGLCEGGPLLALLPGAPRGARPVSVTVASAPAPGAPGSPRVVEVPCAR